MITKEEWIDWKANLVTKAYFQAAQERIEDAKDLLATSAGFDPPQDSFWRGFIQAYRELRDLRIEEVEEIN